MGNNFISSNFINIFVKRNMGNGQVTVEKFGDFLEIKCGKGNHLKRIDRHGRDIATSYLFIKTAHINEVARVGNDNDVIVTIRNGVTYLLDEIEDADACYIELCKM